MINYQNYKARRGVGGWGVELVHPEFSLFRKEEVKFTIQSNVEVGFVEKS